MVGDFHIVIIPPSNDWVALSCNILLFRRPSHSIQTDETQGQWKRYINVMQRRREVQSVSKVSSTRTNHRSPPQVFSELVLQRLLGGP
jgi:hypothetical protein